MSEPEFIDIKGVPCTFPMKPWITYSEDGIKLTDTGREHGVTILMFKPIQEEYDDKRFDRK